MATALPNNNINIPYSPFLNETTGRPNQEWLLWLMNPSFITLNLGSALPVTSGGTGVTAIPTNGQLLIGNGTGYTLNTLATGSGISVANGVGTITVTNTGVLSFSAGSTGLTPLTATTGNVTLAGTLLAKNGGTGFNAYVVGDLLYANSTTTLAKLADVVTGNALISGGVTTAPSWGKIGLTTHVSGILPTGNGGTNLSSFTSGGAVYATSTTVLTTGTLPVGSGGSGATTLTGYLYGNGTSPFTASTTIPNTDITGLGTMSTQNIGVSGSFITANVPPKTVTVTNGIITSIV